MSETDLIRRRASMPWPVPAGVIVGGLAVLGVLQGVIWSQVAPGQQAKVYSDGSYGSLPTADYHPFADLAIFVLAGLAVGLVAAVAAWRVRSTRGTVTLLALFVGASAGAAIAFGVGLALASGVDPATVGATGHESIVVAAPKLATPLVLVAEPAAAVLVYTFLVAWDGRPDLGRVPGGDEARAALETPGPQAPEAAERGPGSGDSATGGAPGPAAGSPAAGSPAGSPAADPDLPGDQGDRRA